MSTRITDWKKELKELKSKKTLTKFDKLRIQKLKKKIEENQQEVKDFIPFPEGTIAKKSSNVFVDKTIKSIEIDKIRLNPEQPRKHFSQEGIESLSKSLKNNGLIEPIVVADIANEFHLIAGERRLKAAKLLGWRTIDAIIDSSVKTKKDIYLHALIENVDRENLNTGELAIAMKHLIEEGYSLSKASEILNMSKTSAYRYKQISQMDNELINLAIQGNVNQPNIMEKISTVQSYDLQKKYIKLLIENKLSLSDILLKEKSKSKKNQLEINYPKIAKVEEGINFIKDNIKDNSINESKINEIIYVAKQLKKMIKKQKD